MISPHSYGYAAKILPAKRIPKNNADFFRERGCQRYIFLVTIRTDLILSSSVVERSAVNRLVVGSNPTWGVLKPNFASSHAKLLWLGLCMLRASVRRANGSVVYRHGAFAENLIGPEIAGRKPLG